MRFGAFPTLLCLFLATVGSHLKADFFLVSSNVAQCDTASNSYADQEELIEAIERSENVINPRISCFKYWLDKPEDDRNILVVYPRDNGEPTSLETTQIQVRGLNFLADRYIKSSEWKNQTFSETTKLLNASRIKINKVGHIFSKTSNLKDNDVITINEFNTFVQSKGIGFVKLVQFNLTRPLTRNDLKTDCDLRASDKVFLQSKADEEVVDGGWGAHSRAALAQLVEECHPNEDKITAKLIANVLLPQLFDFEPVRSKKSMIDIANEPDGSSDNNDDSGRSLDIDEPENEQLEITVNPELAASAENVEQKNNRDNTDLENEPDDLQTEIDELRETNEAAIDSVERAQRQRDEAIRLLEAQTKVKTISEIFDDFSVEVVGQLPGGDMEQLASTGDILISSCRLSVGKSLLSNALDAYMSDDCFEYKFDLSEIDLAKEYTLERLTGGEYRVIVPLLPKRIKTIVSVRTEKLGALTPQTIQNCGVLMTFLKSGTVLKSFDAGKDKAGLYPVPDNNWLSDMGQIKKEDIFYEGLTVRLDVTDRKNQKCFLEKPVEMEITYDKRVQNGKPQALVDRDGNLTLYNLPITAVEGLSLVVFLDTNVGYPDKNHYAFNKSLKNKKDAKSQEVYFYGFLEGLQDYLKVENKLENIKVFKAINSSNDQQSMDDFESLIDEKNIQDAEIKGLVLSKLDEVKNDFVPGQKGGFSNKRKMIRDLKINNTPVKFVSFGPSGLKEDQACNGKKRIVVDSEFLILDVWPRKILDDLYDYEKTTEKADGLVYQCEEYPNIKGFKVSTTTSDPREISSFVAEYLENFLEE